MSNLILSRRKGESIHLTAPNGLPVQITVESVHRGRVELSIKADKSVPVMRSELLDKDGESC